MAQQTRKFEAHPAQRGKCPLLVGLVGPSGSGKTFSALRLAAGMAGDGQVFVVDTENGRALHYADVFRFQHVRFDAPFGPLDYLAAVEFAAGQGAAVIVVDSMSHEHEGPGGVLEQHSKEVERLGGTDRINFLAWAKPKQERRRMVNGLLQCGAHLICCFRAKEKLKIVRGRQPEPRGWQPIGGEEWVYEMTANLLLYPGSNGTPTLRPEIAEEGAMIKIPRQFEGLFGKQLTEKTGSAMAEWAAGGPPKIGARHDPQPVPFVLDNWIAAFAEQQTTDDLASTYRAGYRLCPPGELAALAAAKDKRKAELSQPPPDAQQEPPNAQQEPPDEAQVDDLPGEEDPF